jgi:hypothetical protein
MLTQQLLANFHFGKLTAALLSQSLQLKYSKKAENLLLHTFKTKEEL